MSASPGRRGASVVAALCVALGAAAPAAAQTPGWSAPLDVDTETSVESFAVGAARGRSIVLFSHQSSAAATNAVQLRIREGGEWSDKINLGLSPLSPLPSAAVVARDDEAVLFYGNLGVPFSLTSRTLDAGDVAWDAGPAKFLATAHLEHVMVVYNAPSFDASVTGVAVTHRVDDPADFTDQQVLIIDGQPTGGQAVPVADGSAWMVGAATGQGARTNGFFVARRSAAGVWSDPVVEDSDDRFFPREVFSASADRAAVYLSDGRNGRFRFYEGDAIVDEVDLGEVGVLVASATRADDDIGFCAFHNNGFDLYRGAPDALGPPVSVPVPNGPGDVPPTAIACVINDNGDGLVAWSTSDGIHGVAVVDGAVALDDTIVAPIGSDELRTAVDETGNAVIAWRVGAGVQVSAFDSGLAPVGEGEGEEGEGEEGEGDEGEGEATEGEGDGGTEGEGDGDDGGDNGGCAGCANGSANASVEGVAAAAVVLVLLRRRRR